MWRTGRLFSAGIAEKTGEWGRSNVRREIGKNGGGGVAFIPRGFQRIAGGQRSDTTGLGRPDDGRTRRVYFEFPLTRFDGSRLSADQIVT